LLIVGDSINQNISALKAIKDFTFVASQGRIYVYERQKLIKTISNGNQEIHSFCQMGDYLLAVGDDTVQIWNIKTFEFHNEISFASHFDVSCVLHPSTYVNKVLIGSQQGTMQLWNINSM
jgi:U3 small nucleolar RNA-associated protein 21